MTENGPDKTNTDAYALQSALVKLSQLKIEGK